MKVAIIASRTLKVTDLEKYLPENTEKIITGGAKGIDECAKEYAIQNNFKLIEFFPKYDMHKRAAPLKRNIEIIEYADIVIAFWDKKSKGDSICNK